MKRISASAAACLVGLLGLSLAPHAEASKTFPPALRSKLGLAELPYPPNGCQLCHQNDDGGVRTATKPFGRNVLKNGTVGGNVPSLLAALDAIAADGSDSDHDGVSDIDELKAGTDPNVATVAPGEPLPAQEEIPPPETGCAFARERPGSFASVLLLFAAAASVLGRRQRRRR